MALSKESVLSNGMPIVGLGTWQLEDNVVNGEAAVEAAIDAGYRHVDTAFVYLNEATVGKALQRCFSCGKVRRENMYIVTKLPASCMRADLIEVYARKSLANLQLEYIDLYLLHWPAGIKHDENNLFPVDESGEVELDLESDIISVWKAMEKLVDIGLVKSIGISNFNEEQIGRVLKAARIPPSNLQVEAHVYMQQKALMQFCREHNITVCAYAALGSPKAKQFFAQIGNNEFKDLTPLSDPVVKEIAEKHGKSAGQILLRYLLELGFAVIPKSTNPERIRSNIQLFDFKLSDDDKGKLERLDRGNEGRMFSTFIKGIDKHPEYPFKTC